jgi:hypothetical protein
MVATITWTKLPYRRVIEMTQMLSFDSGCYFLHFCRCSSEPRKSELGLGRGQARAPPGMDLGLGPRA